MNVSTDAVSTIVSTPVIVAGGKVTGPTAPTTESYNLQRSARAAASALEAIADHKVATLVDAWNAGAEYRWALDNGTKGADFIAAVLASVTSVEARNMATSKSTWSKYGKLVKVWASFDQMQAAIHADDVATMSVEAAYLLAVRVSATGKGTREASAPKVPTAHIDKGAGVAAIAEALRSSLSTADLEALIETLIG